MREKLTQLFTPSTERFYNFRTYQITPRELRDLIDIAPESVLCDQKFQEKVFDSIQYSFQYSEEKDVSGWLTAINGFAARNIQEDSISEHLKELVLKELESSSGFGKIKKFERIKNIFRPILEQTIMRAGEKFDHNLLLELSHFRDNPDGFKQYVAELRRVAPTLFSAETIGVMVRDVITPILGNYYIEAPLQIVHLSGFLTEIPELLLHAPDCVLKIHLEIQRNCLALAHLYDKPWSEIFDKSVTEMGLLEEVNTAIINREFEDINIEPATISKWVTFFGLEQLTPGNAAELQTVCNALSRINLLRDEDTKAELLEYMKLVGVTGEMMLSAPQLLDRWSKIIAANLDSSEVPLNDFNQTMVELDVEGVGKQKIGMAVGFKLIERGNYGKAAVVHQSLGLSYLGDSGDPELTNQMHLETAAAVYARLDSDEFVESKLSDLLIFAHTGAMQPQDMLSLLVVPSLKLLPVHKFYEVCRGIANGAGNDELSTDASVTLFCHDVIQLIAADPQLSLKVQKEVTEDFIFNENIAIVKYFIRRGLLDEEYIYTDIREHAVWKFTCALECGQFDAEIKDTFKLSESDISLECVREAACEGAKYNIIDQYSGIYERTIGANAFAEKCGLGGEALTAVIREAILGCVDIDDSVTFFEIASAHGIEPETCMNDPEFQQVVKNSLPKKIGTNTVDAMRYITLFGIADDVASVHKSIYQAWSTKNAVIADVTETFPSYLIDRSFGEYALKGATASKTVSFESALLLNNYYTPPIDPLLYRTERVFGSFVGWKEYDYLHELLVEKAIPDELAELGVSRSGEAGVEQLREIMHDFKGRIILGDVSSSELGASSMLLGYYMDKTRLKVTEWGKTSAGDVVVKIKTSEQYHKGNPDVTFQERYTPSEILKVGTAKELKDFVFDEDFMNRYRVLTGAILKSTNDCDPLKLPLSKKVQAIEFHKELVINTLQHKLAETPSEALVLRAEKEAGKKGLVVTDVLANLVTLRNTQLEQSITTLSSMSLRNVRDVQSNFVELAKYKEFHALLLETVFTFVFMQREHRGEVGNENDNGLSTAAEYAVAKREPTLDGITWTLNFVDHIVNKEVMAQYFTDKNAAKSLRHIASVVAFEKQLAKMTASADDKKTSMQFVPTRGALLEFSGQIGDACWASKYNSIAATFPNFTAVTMVEKPGTELEKLAGSALLIETVSDTGTPLLVIRGLNPLENVINKLQVEDFYTQFTTWAEEQATKMGRTLAIVIDGHSGGSATNRPLLFQFLTSKVPGMKKVRLASDTDTSFNGYSIVNNTYLVYKE